MKTSSEIARKWISRRDFLLNTSALGAASYLGFPRMAIAEPAPETTRLRIHEDPLNCIAPQIIAQELLYAEGFADVRYVNYPKDTPRFPPEDLLAGEVDITVSFTPTDIQFIDSGAPLVILAAAHNGCVELVANDRVRFTRDLKGKTVGVSTDNKLFVAMFAAYVGVDPDKDINWSRSRPTISCLFSPKARSTPSCAAHRYRWSCGRKRSGMCWSTPPPTSPGLTIPVA